MKTISISDFEKVIKNNRCAFLCGNGLSINFDDDFRTIYERLPLAHKDLIHNSKYTLKASSFFKKKFKTNYQNVIDYLRFKDLSILPKIFEDGVIFANWILTNQKLVNELDKNNRIIRLVFGLSNMELVKSIAAIGLSSGYKSVSIEYWSVLIYFYYAICSLNDFNYTFPDDNYFIDLIRVGDHIKGAYIPNSNSHFDIYQYVFSNGFNNYYRMLFCVAIFNNGKAIDVKELKNISAIDIEKLYGFLYSFDVIFTLNYDMILENIQDKTVHHLHGKFVPQKQEFVWGQSLGLSYGSDKYCSFSDILIGDYFVNKTAFNIVSSLAKNNPYNKLPLNTYNIIENQISETSCNTIIIFGMSIDNDQHILRNIICAFEKANITNAKIVYCGFTDEQNEIFEKTFNTCITFSDELSAYARSIERIFISSQDILIKYFLK